MQKSKIKDQNDILKFKDFAQGALLDCAYNFWAVCLFLKNEYPISNTEYRMIKFKNMFACGEGIDYGLQCW